MRKQKISFLLFLLVFIYSCKKDSLTSEQITPDKEFKLDTIKTELKERLKLVTLLTHDVFESNKSLKKEYVRLFNSDKVLKSKESIYFSDLIGKGKLANTNFAKTFIQSVINKFESERFAGAEKVKSTIQRLKNEINLKKTSISVESDDFAETVVLLPYLGSHIYFPFSEDFPNVDMQTTYYCYDPIDDNATSIEVFKNEGGIILNQIAPGGDSWAQAHPTIVIKVDDLIAGNHLTNYRTSPCTQGNFFTELCQNELYQIATPDSITPPPPPPSVVYNGPLPYNISPSAYNTIDDRYLLSASLPRIRLMKNLRPHFWNGGNDLSLYRGNARIANPNFADFNVAVIDTSMAVFRHFTIGRRDAANKRWVYPLVPYTYDWRLVQENNYVALTVLRSWLYFGGADINFNANAGVRFDPLTNTWVPSFDASVNLSGKISLGRVRESFEGENYITRRSFLSNAIGDNFGLGATCDKGVDCGTKNWAIRRIDDKLEYYFKINLTY